MMELDLQLFADGGGDGGGGSSSSGAAPAGDSTGVKDGEAAALIQEYRQKRGKGRPQHEQARLDKQSAPAMKPAQRPASAQETAPETAPAERDLAKEFDALIDGEYKDLFGKKVSNIVQERLKGRGDAEAALSKLQPALEALFTKHGIEAGDLDGLVNKITNDDSLYEDEALQRGIPVEMLKEMKALQQQSQAYQQMREEQAQRQIMEAHFQKLVQQAEEAKQFYPGIDLRNELQNPTFAKLIHPSVGIDVRTAYEIAHKDEIQPQMAAAIAQKTKEKLSAAVQAGRVMENGLNTATGPVSLSDDPRNWSRAERQKIADRARRGERITF